MMIMMIIIVMLMMMFMIMMVVMMIVMMCYKKPFNYFKRLDASSNDDYGQNITLIVNSQKIYIS